MDSSLDSVEKQQLLRLVLEFLEFNEHDKILNFLQIIDIKIAHVFLIFFQNFVITEVWICLLY